MDSNSVKSSRDEYDDDPNERSTKVKRFDIEVPVADVDIKLAQKLDNILRISSDSKPRFLTNRTKLEGQEQSNTTATIEINPARLKPRNLTKQELHERVLRKYDTLVAGEIPRSSKVNVKFLSTSESIELGKDQARRQMERQLELNSISGNQSAISKGPQGFRFNDGYEMPDRYFSGGAKLTSHHSRESAESILKHRHDSTNCSKSVKFVREDVDKTDDEAEVDDPSGLSDSDCT